MKTSQITIKSIEMYRGNGYGQYKIVAEFIYEGETYKVSIHSTDSQLWDNEERDAQMLFDHIGGEDGLLSRI